MSDSTKTLNSGAHRELKDLEPDEPAMIDLSAETAEAIHGGETTKPAPKPTTTSTSHLFEIEDFSFDIEQPGTISS